MDPCAMWRWVIFLVVLVLKVYFKEWAQYIFNSNRGVVFISLDRQYFSKVDLSHACQHILFDDNLVEI